MKNFVMIKRKHLIEGGIYHVTQRAPGAEMLFITSTDYRNFLRFSEYYLEKFNIILYAYSLMPNHVHFLLQISEKNLSKCMKHIFGKYAMYLNKKYKRKGHVFCGVYRAVYCESPKAVINVSKYIHLNAFKAKLVDKPLKYKWHSLEPYIINTKKHYIINKNFILNLLNYDLIAARREYSQFIDPVYLENSHKKKAFN